MFARAVPVLLMFAVPAVAAAAPRTFADLASTITGLLDNATAVLIVLGLVVYFYGISTNILNFGNEGMEKVRTYFFWGIIVLFLMVSIWGVLHLVQNTIFGGEQFNTGTADTSSDSGGYTSQNLFSPPSFSE